MLRKTIALALTLCLCLTSGVFAENESTEEVTTVYGNAIDNKIAMISLENANLPENKNVIFDNAATAVVTEGEASNNIAFWNTPGVAPEVDDLTSEIKPSEVKFLNMIKNKPLDEDDIGKVFKATLKFKPFGYNNVKVSLGIRSLNGNLLESDGTTVKNHPWACADSDYITLGSATASSGSEGKIEERYFVIDDFMADPDYQIGLLSMKVESWGSRNTSTYSYTPGVSLVSLTVEDTGWRVAKADALGYCYASDPGHIRFFPSLGVNYTNTTNESKDIMVLSGIYKGNGTKKFGMKTYTVKPGETITAYSQNMNTQMYNVGRVWHNDGEQMKYMIWEKDTLVPQQAASVNKEINFMNIIPNLATRPTTVQAAKDAATTVEAVD